MIRGTTDVVLYCFLVHTTQQPVPALSLQDGITSRLRGVFTQWNNTKGSGTASPTKVIYPLNGKYPRDNLRRQVLTGLDARSVDLLNNIAMLHRSNVALATLTYEVHGSYITDHCCGYSE